MKQLDPKAVWFFFFKYCAGIFFMMIVFSIPFVILSTVVSSELTNTSAAVFPLIFLGGWWSLFLGFLVLGYIWSYYSYKFYKYEVREDGFRKEHGVIWKKYVTIPYERIQNVDIYRGLLARILGLSDLNIQTAGMSTTVGSYGGVSEGRLPGLNPKVAEELRDELIKKARGKNQGL